MFPFYSEIGYLNEKKVLQSTLVNVKKCIRREETREIKIKSFLTPFYAKRSSGIVQTKPLKG